jgi:hypothetical protein
LSDIDKLRVELNNEQDSAKRNAIYLKIKQLDREQRGIPSVSRLRGI